MHHSVEGNLRLQHSKGTHAAIKVIMRFYKMKKTKIQNIAVKNKGKWRNKDKLKINSL